MASETVGFGTVAVVIPTFNRRDLVLQSVRAVLSQTHRDLVCLVIDNGSSDGTPEAIAELDDGRVRTILHDRPLGASAARNVGIGAAAAAGADWVAFLDADDLWAPTKLSRQLEALADHPDSGWSTVGCVHIDPGRRPFSGVRMQSHDPGCRDTLLGTSELLRRLSRDNVMPAGDSTVLVRRSLLDSVGGFDPGLVGCEDWDLWIRLASVSPLVYVDEPLVAYRIWDGQVSKDVAVMAAGAARVLERHFPGDREARRASQRRWRQLSARQALEAGRRKDAAVRYTGAALFGLAPGQLVYAGASLLAPALARRRLKAVEARDHLDSWTIPPSWAGALSWLECESLIPSGDT